LVKEQYAITRHYTSHGTRLAIWERRKKKEGSEVRVRIGFAYIVIPNEVKDPI
jgi:hypothetical protein